MRWLPSERKRFIMLYEEGYRLCDIAVKLDRDYNSVYKFASQHGIKSGTVLTQEVKEKVMQFRARVIQNKNGV